MGQGRGELDDWMAAEREGREAEADAGFALVFRGRVPRLGPSPGFGDRVASAVAVRVGPPLVRQAFPLWVRAVLAATLAVVGAAGSVFWSRGIFDLARLAHDSLPTARTLAGAAASWLAAAGHAWAVVVTLARAAAFAAASGPAAAVIALNLAIALSASCALKRLLAPQEE